MRLIFNQRTKVLAGILKEQDENQNVEKQKKIFVLVGPPSVGKSTWIKSNFKDVEYYIISRDDIVENVANHFGWTYDDLYVSPPDDTPIGTIDPKYGEVVVSPKGKYMEALSYVKVLEANEIVRKRFDDRLYHAKFYDIVIVDMTNMSKDSRKNSLRSIKSKSEEYKKIAVVFKFKGIEDIIAKVAQKRYELEKTMGISKSISSASFERMFKSFQEISPSEGFDEIIDVDNTEILRNIIKN